MNGETVEDKEEPTGSNVDLVDAGNLIVPRTEKADSAVFSALSPPPPVPTPARNNRSMWYSVAAVVAVVIIIVASVVATRSDGEYEENYSDGVSVDFVTGVSLITSYSIDATISQRLARTVVNMEIANALDCTSIHGIILQLPLHARVASLQTLAQDGCTTTGVVKEIGDARETFAESASQGLPGAYVEARDSTTYSIQVSLPPMGNTIVELVLEEIMRQKVGEIEFQLPLVPNEQVDQVSLAIKMLGADSVDAGQPTDTTTNGTISEPAGLRFGLDLGPDLQVGTVFSPYFLEIPDAREYDLPRVLRGAFTPAALPDQGVLHVDGNCFEHLFLPSSLEPKSKNIFFLVDISSWNSYDEQFFTDTKKALKTAIDALTPQDTLTIQAFSDRGTKELWGSTKATDGEKEDAKKFVDSLKKGNSANLHEALLEGMLRAKRDADNDDGTVTLLVLISDSWASTGTTDRSKIVSDVWNLNQEGKVKLFALASPSADHELLQAIAITNGGVTSRIASGTVDYAEQMQTFFESEFGNVLLSDVRVDFGKNNGVYGETRSSFPVLASGSEVVVRGLLSTNSTMGQDASIRAITTANSHLGAQTWTAVGTVDPLVSSIGLPNSRCFQSYAHSRITQLMHLRDVAILLGDGVVEPIVTLIQDCDRKEHTFADCIKEEALGLALAAQLVTVGLTGMVTVDDDKCLPFEEGAEICLDGTAKSDFWNNYDADESDSVMMEYGPEAEYAYASGSRSTSVSFYLVVMVASLCTGIIFDVWHW